MISRELISGMFKEDIGDGDHTSLACIETSKSGGAQLIVKDHGVIAGVELAQEIFHFADEQLLFEVLNSDGAEVAPSDIAFTVNGSIRSILKAERIVLNCMQRMSGIATMTRKLVKQIEGLSTRLIDTRKTTPGFRFLEKWAVRIGGGENHRFGLYDMIMIKDNHIDFAGGIEKAILRTSEYLKTTGKDLKIAVEARNIKDVKKIINIGGVHRIMLDNFRTDDVSVAVALVNKKYETEATGGINEENIRVYAECGVDYISVGALTHSVKSMDLSLKAYEVI